MIPLPAAELALWINTPITPSSFRTSLMAEAMFAGLLTSAVTGSAEGSSFASSLMKCGERAINASEKPSRANRRARAAPRPGPTPVMTATRLTMAASTGTAYTFIALKRP